MVRLVDFGRPPRRDGGHRTASTLPLLVLSLPMLSMASASLTTVTSSLSAATLLGGAVVGSLSSTAFAVPVAGNVDARGQPNQWLGQNPAEVYTGYSPSSSTAQDKKEAEPRSQEFGSPGSHTLARDVEAHPTHAQSARQGTPTEVIRPNVQLGPSQRDTKFCPIRGGRVPSYECTRRRADGGIVDGHYVDDSSSPSHIKLKQKRSVFATSWLQPRTDCWWCFFAEKRSQADGPRRHRAKGAAHADGDRQSGGTTPKGYTADDAFDHVHAPEIPQREDNYQRRSPLIFLPGNGQSPQQQQGAQQQAKQEQAAQQQQQAQPQQQQQAQPQPQPSKEEHGFRPFGPQPRSPLYGQIPGQSYGPQTPGQHAGEGAGDGAGQGAGQTSQQPAYGQPQRQSAPVNGQQQSSQQQPGAQSQAASQQTPQQAYPQTGGGIYQVSPAQQQKQQQAQQQAQQPQQQQQQAGQKRGAPKEAVAGANLAKSKFHQAGRLANHDGHQAADLANHDGHSAAKLADHEGHRAANTANTDGHRAAALAEHDVHDAIAEHFGRAVAPRPRHYGQHAAAQGHAEADKAVAKADKDKASEQAHADHAVDRIDAEKNADVAHNDRVIAQAQKEKDQEVADWHHELDKDRHYDTRDAGQDIACAQTQANDAENSAVPPENRVNDYTGMYSGVVAHCDKPVRKQTRREDKPAYQVQQDDTDYTGGEAAGFGPGAAKWGAGPPGQKSSENDDKSSSSQSQDKDQYSSSGAFDEPINRVAAQHAAAHSAVNGATPSAAAH